MKTKAAWISLIILSLASCQGKASFPFGEKPDSSKEFPLFRMVKKDGETYEELLVEISAANAQRLLLRDEALSLLVTKKGCPSCQSFFDTFKESLSSLPFEVFSINPSEAMALRNALSLAKTTFGQGTPGWYLLKKGSVREIAYGDEEDKDALKRRIKAAFEEYATPLNAYRPASLEDNEAFNEDYSSLTYCLDESMGGSLDLYLQTFLPFLKETTVSSAVLDLSLFDASERKEAQSRFLSEGTYCPLRYRNTLITAEELPSFLTRFSS